MKNLVLFTVVVGLLVFVFACGGGDSPKAVMNDYLSCMEDFSSTINNAKDADGVVAAINKFSNGMKDLVPRMKAMQEKHPELKTMGMDGKMPEEFKQFAERSKEIGTKMMGIFGKIGQYATDPKVMEAQKKLQEVMSSLK